MLEGKKTKSIASITIVWAIVGLFLGKIEPQVAWQMILAGGAVFSLRDAIK